MPRKKQEMDLITLFARFHDDAACRASLEELRWPDGVKCLRCESDNISRIATRKLYQCDSCDYQFSVLTATTFHDTHLPLPKWFAAVYLMVESKKGISALQMQRSLKVSYKTAWYLCHRIRAAMGDGDHAKLSGIVEADETYVGGKARGKGRGYTGNKTMVLGIIQRGGDIRMQVEKHADRTTLHKFVHEHAGPDTEAIHTDEWPAYKGVGKGKVPHETVNHKQEEWVRSDVHTQSIESAWSLFKRSIVGAYHRLSEQHMDAYLDEFEWRFNNRNNPWLFRDTLVKLLKADSLTYRDLVSNSLSMPAKLLDDAQ